MNRERVRGRGKCAGAGCGGDRRRCVGWYLKANIGGLEVEVMMLIVVPVVVSSGMSGGNHDN